jgi:hypothetical protein
LTLPQRFSIYIIFVADDERKHLINSLTGVLKKLRRFKMLSGSSITWIVMNDDLLMKIMDLVTTESKQWIIQFILRDYHSIKALSL